MIRVLTCLATHNHPTTLLLASPVCALAARKSFRICAVAAASPCALLGGATAA